MEDSEEERSDVEEETVEEQLEDVGGGTAAGHGLEPRSRGVFEELWEEEDADELKENEDEEEEEEEDAGVKTEPETEVKTEHGEETEPYEESGYYETEEVYETEPSRESSILSTVRLRTRGTVECTIPGLGTVRTATTEATVSRWTTKDMGKPTRSLGTIGGRAASSRGTQVLRREGSKDLPLAGDPQRPGRCDLRQRGCMDPLRDGKNGMAGRLRPDERLLRPPLADLSRRASSRSK
ncbi:hypothetical protein PF008_g14729 [Phytophthora fragariae]|uniref:Uncharacterized protein n=1 Tax=Phytophthora fragariae TaxID=53985 RepID=A0A6G0RG82_9STRA|nr:hypothetical protein PF008_g14729 [Phytophthora fragariae]